MGFYATFSFRIFGDLVEKFVPYFTELKLNLRRARMRISIQEYLSMALMTSLLIFLILLPITSFLFGLIKGFGFLFSFMSSFTLSVFLSIVAFFIIVYYPQLILKQRAKEVDNSLPFAALYLSTVASTGLPLHKTFEIFSKFSEYGEITNEINNITNDVQTFGIDINTAMERAIERTASKDFKELLWGLLSTMQAGGDESVYLKEKSRSLMEDYRRKLFEFSHQLTVYIEVYLTTIILGAIFFTILTAIMSGLAGGASNIILLQFFLIFIFLPMVSILFIFLVKSITPSEE
ncbi:hypothetical protein DRP07_06535 [Archaeoglobales archaeon]|mgnify:CR=1 FL=1|nr:MAG: hypothetical protein DRP07_06535 [Archaeoglobales archaeon]